MKLDKPPECPTCESRDHVARWGAAYKRTPEGIEEKPGPVWFCTACHARVVTHALRMALGRAMADPVSVAYWLKLEREGL